MNPSDDGLFFLVFLLCFNRFFPEYISLLHTVEHLSKYSSTPGGAWTANFPTSQTWRSAWT
jgi:hypothetical protein